MAEFIHLENLALDLVLTITGWDTQILQEALKQDNIVRGEINSAINNIARLISLSLQAEINNRISGDNAARTESINQDNLTRAASFTQFVSNLNRISLEESNRAEEDNQHADDLSRYVTDIVGRAVLNSVGPFNVIFSAIYNGMGQSRNEINNIRNDIGGFMNDPIGIILGIIFEVIGVFLIDEITIGLSSKSSPIPARENYQAIASLKFNALLHGSTNPLTPILETFISTSTIWQSVPNSHRDKLAGVYPITQFTSQ